MTSSEIFVYDIEKDSRSGRHSFSLDDFCSTGRQVAVVAVEDELLAVLRHRCDGTEDNFTFLAHGRGLDMQNEEMVWEKARCCRHL